MSEVLDQSAVRGNRPSGRTDRKAAWTRWLIPPALAVVVALVFLPSVQNDFVNWDDDRNIVKNPRFGGFSGEQLRWMFTTFHMGHYQPLSWLSLNLDHHLWGMNAGGFHLTSMLLHVANTLLLFWVARRLLWLGYGDWPSALRPRLEERSESGPRPPIHICAGVAALLFALHPLRVESVAWATERRDVLSASFFLLAVLAYLRAAQASRPRVKWLAAAFAMQVLSLFSKAIAVMLPAVLLALDVYPLRRLGGGKGRWLGPAVRRVWLEKIPFVLLSCVFAGLALSAQECTGALIRSVRYDVWTRAAVAGYGTVFYLTKTAMPFDLSCLYEMRVGLNPFGAGYLLSAGIALAITVFLLADRRRRPACLVAWVCYLVLIAPVSGIAQSGPQITADRYTYLSCMPFAVLIGGWMLFRPRRTSRFRLIAGLWVVVMGAFVVLTQAQLGVWRNTKSLWFHALRLDPGSAFANDSVGQLMRDRGCRNAALLHYNRALRVRPGFAQAYNNRGIILGAENPPYEAATPADHLKAMDLDLRGPRLRTKVGMILHRVRIGLILGDEDEIRRALTPSGQEQAADPDCNEHRLQTLLHVIARLATNRKQIYKALALVDHVQALHGNPREPRFQTNLGAAMHRLGVVREAIVHLRRAAELDPYLAVGQLNLGKGLLSLKEFEGAQKSFERALRLKPDWAEAHNDLAGALESQTDLDGAIEHLRRALALRPDYVKAQANLATVLLKQKKFGEAIRCWRRVVELEPDNYSAMRRLAWVLATCSDPAHRDGAEALKLAERVAAAKGAIEPVAMNTLAAAYAALKRFPEAVRTAERAAEAAERMGMARLAGDLRERLALYRSGRADPRPR